MHSRRPLRVRLCHDARRPAWQHHLQNRTPCPVSADRRWDGGGPRQHYPTNRTRGPSSLAAGLGRFCCRSRVWRGDGSPRRDFEVGSSPWLPRSGQSGDAPVPTPTTPRRTPQSRNARNARNQLIWRRPSSQLGEPPQVLCDGREGEFELGATRAPETQSDETQDALQSTCVIYPTKTQFRYANFRRH
jgi:hypothetical protein